MPYREILKEIIHDLRCWNWQLFIFILLFIGLPNVYQLYRVYLVGNEIPDIGSLAIVSQWQFVGLVVEIFQEATVLAIFFFIGSKIRDGTSIQLDRAKSVFTFIFLASIVFSLLVFLLRDQFITIIGTSDDIREQTRTFLGISIFSIPFTLLFAATIVLLEALNLKLLVLVMAILNIAVRFILDTIFFGGYSFSLEASIAGVGWSTLLTSAILFLIGIGLVIKTRKVEIASITKLPTFKDMYEYLRVSAGSGTDSLIRNIAYFVMIIRIVNTIGSQEIGGYYLTIQILWSFALVPVLALADVTKALVANNAQDIHKVRAICRTSIIITLGIILIWIILTPAFPTAARFLSDDADTVQWAMTAFAILLLPYILLSFNLVADSVFYGTGKTKYMAYQSIITNGSVYLIAFLLYIAGIWDPTFEGVMILFALGIIVDSCLTLIFLLLVLNPKRYAPTTQASSDRSHASHLS